MTLYEATKTVNDYKALIALAERGQLTGKYAMFTIEELESMLKRATKRVDAIVEQMKSGEVTRIM